MSSSVSAAVGGVARREPQPTGAKRGNYTALNLQPYKSSAGGGAGAKHYGGFTVVLHTKRLDTNS